MGHFKLKLLLSSVMLCLVFHKAYAYGGDITNNDHDYINIGDVHIDRGYVSGEQTDNINVNITDANVNPDITNNDHDYINIGDVHIDRGYVSGEQTDNINVNITDANVNPGTSEIKVIFREINAPLIVVSNRLPFVLTRNSENKKELKRTTSAGGLVTAVAPVVVKCKGTWIGWTGLFDLEPDEQIPEPDSDDNTPTAGLKSSQIIPVYIEKKDFEEYYNGFCNNTLWPLFHSMPDRVKYDAKEWETYYSVNENFAMRTLEALRNSIKALNEVGDQHIVPIVWIHDYQLLSAATIIRNVAKEEGLRCKLGFFLHIPFPSLDMMNVLPIASKIMLGMLAYDFVAFHIKDYGTNFIDCCHRILKCRVDHTNMLVELNERIIQVKDLPIGVPYDHFENMANNAPTKTNLFVISNRRFILGIDRLDYTKGIINRLLSFERFLEKYTVYHGKIIFYQISVPSRTDVAQYIQLKNDTDQLIGRINGRFSKIDWVPIVYIYNYVKQEDLAALYRDSAVTMVTPLRDGMNLVSKEFVACQVKEPGVLVLSSFAGASITMTEALMVNPYDTEKMADVLHHALELPIEERKTRMQKLKQRERKYDINYWMASCFSWMGALKDEGSSISMQPQKEDIDKHLGNYFSGAEKICLILDYNCIRANNNSNAIPNQIIEILKKLSDMPDINIAIQSDQKSDELMKMVGIPNITYSGNNGTEIQQPDGMLFEINKSKNHANKIEQLKNLLEEVCVDGGRIESNIVTLTYYYENVPQIKQENLKNRAIEIIKNYGFNLHLGDTSIQAILSWNLGESAIHILQNMYGFEWIAEGIKVVYAGSEEAIVTLKDIAWKFLVDSSQLVNTTVADYRLSGPQAVYTMLEWVEEYMRHRVPTLKRSVSSNRLKYLQREKSSSLIRYAPYNKSTV